MTDLWDVGKFNNILDEIKINEHNGVKNFADKYGKYIKLIICLYAKSVGDLEEVYNDVLLKVWQLGLSKKRVKAPKGWLYKVTKNKILDYIKLNKKHEPLYENIRSEFDGIQKFIDDESFLAMIKQLNDKEREILIARIKWGLEFAEIAEIKNKPLSTISATFYRARDKLKKLNIK